MAEAEKLSRPEGYLPRRTKGCGQCAGCKRPNCDACRFCMDNPRNGGKNKLKQRCLHRVCTNFSVPIQPPAMYRAQTRLASDAGLTDDPTNRPKRQKFLPKKLSGNAMVPKSAKLPADAEPKPSSPGRRTLRMTAGGHFRGVRKTPSEISPYQLRKQLKLDMEATEYELRAPRLKAKARKGGRTKGQSRGCGQCAGCLRPNCNACKYCMDNPRNGGKNILRKRCLLRVCTKKSAQPPAKYRAQRLSAASVGLKGEVKLEQSVIVNPPTMSGEHQEASAIPWTVNTESRHTAVVVVDDPDSHHKMQKIFPEKLAGNATECSAGKPKNTANASPKSHLGKKTVIMKAGRRSGGMRKPHSETSSRTLRRRSGRPDAVSPQALIAELPVGVKFSTLRRQLKIEMAGPGATLSQQKVESVKDSSTLSKQKVESVKDNSTLSQQKVESEKDSSTLSQQKVESEKASSTQMSGISPTTAPLMMAANALSLLAHGAANKPKLSSSPSVAKISKDKGHPDNPSVWNVDEVQQYIADCGFLDISRQLKEEMVDGEAMLDLTPIWLVKCMGIKMGPAIKVCKCVEELKAKMGTSKHSI